MPNLWLVHHLASLRRHNLAQRTARSLLTSPRSGRHRAQAGQHRPTPLNTPLGQIWRCLVPRSVEIAPLLSDTRPSWPNLGRIRRMTPHIWPSETCRSQFCQHRQPSFATHAPQGSTRLHETPQGPERLRDVPHRSARLRWLPQRSAKPRESLRGPRLEDQRRARPHKRARPNGTGTRKPRSRPKRRLSRHTRRGLAATPNMFRRQCPKRCFCHRTRPATAEYHALTSTRYPPCITSRWRR